MTPSHHLEEIRKEFYSKIADFKIDPYPMQDIADWWLQKFSDLQQKVSEMKVEPATGHPAQFNYDKEWYVGYNQAINDFLALFPKK